MRSGARQRSILIGCFAEHRFAGHLQTAHLCNVRMATKDRCEATGTRVPPPTCDGCRDDGARTG